MPPTGTAYRERDWIDAVLDHGDTDGQCAAVQVAVLPGLARGNVARCLRLVEPHKNGRHLVQNVDGSLGSRLSLGMIGWHFAGMWLKVLCWCCRGRCCRCCRLSMIEGDSALCKITRLRFGAVLWARQQPQIALSHPAFATLTTQAARTWFPKLHNHNAFFFSNAIAIQ